MMAGGFLLHLQSRSSKWEPWAVGEASEERAIAQSPPLPDVTHGFVGRKQCPEEALRTHGSCPCCCHACWGDSSSCGDAHGGPRAQLSVPLAAGENSDVFPQEGAPEGKSFILQMFLRGREERGRMFDPFLLKKKKHIELMRLRTVQLGSLASGRPFLSTQTRPWSEELEQRPLPPGWQMTSRDSSQALWGPCPEGTLLPPCTRAPERVLWPTWRRRCRGPCCCCVCVHSGQPSDTSAPGIL